MEEVKQFMGNDDSWILSTLFPIKKEEYLPYCDINSELYQDVNSTLDESHAAPKVGRSAQIATNMSDTSLSSAASTLCSFRVNDTIPIDHVLDPTNFNLVNNGEHTSHSTCQSSLSSSSSNDCSSSYQEIQHQPDIFPDLNHHCSDDSDSEIFRVKRRSSKVERNVGGGTMSSHDQVQGHIQPRRMQPEGRSGERAPSDYCESNQSRGRVPIKYTKVISARDMPLPKGSNIPRMDVSNKRKKTLNGSSLKYRQKSVISRFEPRDVKNARELPSVEMAPKRLKVKGPSFLGSDERIQIHNPVSNTEKPGNWRRVS